MEKNDEKLLLLIKAIIKSGKDVEIKSSKDGIKVYAVSKKVLN